MADFYAYIRVSTARQGGNGVSLEQQKAAIESYAAKQGLNVTRWFEEQQTAAKRGRKVFSEMLKLLKRGPVRGVVMHKIDRSARNLTDWADLGELIDSGIDVHFANESLDLKSRGGRLSADIQAVVAADYIRNLREETKKGFYGRLKQGLYPRPAPVGYLDQGKGKAKLPDPEKAPLVRSAFALYATGNYNLRTLSARLAGLGLRSRTGKLIRISELSKILNNRFYTGVIAVKKTGQVFQGLHEPIVSIPMFEQVRDLLRGRVPHRLAKHDSLFRKLLTCGVCGKRLIGERQTGRFYYRCHTRGCPTMCIREDSAERVFIKQLTRLEFTQAEKDWFRSELSGRQEIWDSEHEKVLKSTELALEQVSVRLDRLTDALLDSLIDKETFERRKLELLNEQVSLQARLKDLRTNKQALVTQLSQLLEMCGNAYLTYKMGILEEKRELIDTLTSKRLVVGKSLEFELKTPFHEVATRLGVHCGSPSRDVHRIWSRLINKLLNLLQQGQKFPLFGRKDDEGELPEAA